MIKSRWWLLATLASLFLSVLPLHAVAKEKQQGFSIPNHVLSISKENTFPNASADQAVVEPSELTKELIDTLGQPVDNPELIKLLNETTIRTSPTAVGYRAMVYLGHWPLTYQSSETAVNWEYKKINVNEANNLGGDTERKLQYSQQEQATVKGALTSQITNAEEVRKMMLLRAKQKTNLPVANEAVFGRGTKTDNTYVIPTQKHGKLNAFAPAVNEKGEVTFGELYLELKGSKKALVVKNVTKQGIGGWIPIQDHVSFSLQLK